MEVRVRVQRGCREGAEGVQRGCREGGCGHAHHAAAAERPLHIVHLLEG